MASAQIEALESDTYATDVPETKHDDTSGVLKETEAFECEHYVGPVDTVKSRHSGTMVDSAEMECLESADSEKAISGYVEAAGISDTMASCDNDDLQGGGIMLVNTEAVVEKTEALDCDSCAVDFVEPADVEAAGSEQDGPMMASTTAEGFDYVSTVDDFRVSPTEEGVLTSSPEGPKIEEQAISTSLEDVEAHDTVPNSVSHVKQDLTLTANSVFNQEESFRVACASGKIEGDKFVNSAFHDLEENQGAEQTYDIDFDIVEHDTLEGSFFYDSSLFPALVSDKTEAWHAGVDDVTMVEASPQAGSNKHHAVVDLKSFSGETNSEPAAKHDVKETDVASKEEWITDTQRQPGSVSLLADAFHGVEESSDLSIRHRQGAEEPTIYPCKEADVETLAASVVQDKDFACVDSKDADAQAVPLHHAAEDIFASLAGANVETVYDADISEAKELAGTNVKIVYDADTSEAKELEEEVNTKVALEENKIEPTPINAPHDDGADHLYELDQGMAGGSSLMDVEHVKAEIPLEDRLESDKGEEKILTQVEFQGRGSSLHFEKIVECIDVQSNEANADDHLMVKNSSFPVDSSDTASVVASRETLMEAVSEAPTNNPASIVIGNMEPEYGPIISEQGECASVIMCRETSMEAESEALVQEEPSTFEQNAVHDKFVGDNNDSQAGDSVLSSHVEADTLMEPVQNQRSDLVVVDEKSVNEFGNDVLFVRNNDVKEICDIGVETVEMGKVGGQEEKASSKEHEQSDKKIVDVADCSVPGPSKSELKETHGRKDETEVVTVAEHEKRVSNKEQKQSAGASAYDFDSSVQEVEKSGVEESLEREAGVVEREAAVAEQEKEAATRECDNHLLTPLAGAVPPQAESVEEVKEQELSFMEETIHHSSSSNYETNVSAGIDFTQKMGVHDGLMDSEDSAPLGKSGKMRGMSADTYSKKKLEKGFTDDKLPKAEHLNKSNVKKPKEAVGSKHGDHVNISSRSELEEEPIAKKPEKAVKQGLAFGIGDLVWAKVRSHPWWPAQIFDPADASKAARKAKKSGRVLVAFFGDCTFAWLQQSQMIAFRPNFKEKVQQTTMRIFCLAVQEALEELCRRSELGLSCRHFEGALHSTSSFPDANTGIREGVRGESLKKIRASAEIFRPKKTLEFVRNVAASPFGDWSSTLQWAESRGHAYGLRTCMVVMQGSDSAPVLPTPPVVPSQGPKLKRSYSSLDAEGFADAGNVGKESKKAKKLKSEKERKEGQCSLTKAEKIKRVTPDGDAGERSGLKDLTDASDKKKDRNVIKIKLSKKMKSDHLSSSERRSDTAPGEEIGGERVSDDSKETLLAMAGHSVKPFKRSSLKQERAFSTFKKVWLQIGEESKDDTSMHRASKASPCEGVPDMDADVTGMEDAFDAVPSSLRDGGEKTDTLKMPVEVGLKKEVFVKDNNAGKSAPARKLSKVGDSIRRIASELTGTPIVKVVDDVRRTEPKLEKKMKELALERDASPVGKKAILKEASEDVSLLQLRRDLELVAKKAGSGGAKGKAIKQSRRGGGQVEAVAAKSSPQWQSVPQKSQKSCVQELALAARKRKFEIAHDEVVAKLPKNSSTTGSQRHHAPKGYITSADKPGERRSYDKNAVLYSRRPAPPASSTKSSTQRYDEKLSSHAPLGLFMRFPENFPLPSEAQLKATFIPFGPLQMSATRLYKDSASAQVVFKHGRDAESALKHAKKNSMFGQVAVTYRLRHLSHSVKVEAKSDTTFPNKAHSSQVAALKGSAPSREASPERKGGDEVVGSSAMLSPNNHDTHSALEPTGDIQDQMMTLLRQVSVIVNTSPVTSDGT